MEALVHQALTKYVETCSPSVDLRIQVEEVVKAPEVRSMQENTSTCATNTAMPLEHTLKDMSILPLVPVTELIVLARVRMSMM
jgi:hypothetical protein